MSSDSSKTTTLPLGPQSAASSACPRVFSAAHTMADSTAKPFHPGVGRTQKASPGAPKPQKPKVQRWKTKKPTVTPTAAAAASPSASSGSTLSPASSSSSSSSSSSLALGFASDRASRVAARTLQLIEAMVGQQSILMRVKDACKLVEDDDALPESMLDMSLLPKENQAAPSSATPVCAFFSLLRLCAETGLTVEENKETADLKRSAQQLLGGLMDYLLPQLLRSFDASITHEFTGNNALHELLTLAAPTTTAPWLPQLIRELVRHGVDLNKRNNRGETVALCYVAKMRPDTPSTILRLLLHLGSDINAQDPRFSTVMHSLVSKRAFGVLHELYADGTAISDVEYFRTDFDGRNIIQLAAYQCMRSKNDDGCEDMYRFLESQVQMVQEKRIEALCVPLIPDLAMLALQYLDGSGRPFVVQRVEEEVPEWGDPGPRIRALNSAASSLSSGSSRAPPVLAPVLAPAALAVAAAAAAPVNPAADPVAAAFDALEGLMANRPPYQQMRALMQTRPALIPMMFHQMSQRHPELGQYIGHNYDALVATLAGGGGGGGGAE